MPSMLINKFTIGAAIGLLWSAGIYLWAYYSGKHEGRVEQLEEVVKAEQERREIDGRVQDLTDYDLCLRLVRLPDRCDELRGVEKTSNNK